MFRFGFHMGQNGDCESMINTPLECGVGRYSLVKIVCDCSEEAYLLTEGHNSMLFQEREDLVEELLKRASELDKKKSVINTIMAGWLRKWATDLDANEEEP